MRRLLLLLLVLLQPVFVSAEQSTEQNDTIWVYDPSTGVSYPATKTEIIWMDAYGRTENETKYVLNKTDGVQKLLVEHKIDIGGNKTVIVYDADMVRAYQSLVAEQRINITRLQSELEKKNKQIAELIQLKKTNVELQKNISKLNNQITTLKAENELLKQQNEQYKDIITDLMAKTSNQTIEDTKEIYEKDKKLIGGFTWSFTIGLVSVVVIAYSLMRLKQKYEDL
jgi:DNA repair exonuclease SbcCD ATPase subunit